MADGVAQLNIKLREGVAEGRVMAESLIGPMVRHAMQAGNMASTTLGCSIGDVNENLAVITDAAEKVASGDMSEMSAMLAAQAITLDATFTALLKRSHANVGQYPEAAERFMKMALKAQGQSRAAIEALAKVVRGGEQIVRHIHVDNRGGQAVIAETVTTGGGGREDETATQPHEPFATLRSPDPIGDGVPLACDQGQEAVSASRGAIDGRANG